MRERYHKAMKTQGQTIAKPVRKRCNCDYLIAGVIIIRDSYKVPKSMSVFPTDDSLLKMLYLAMMDITKKWTGKRQDWSAIYAQMAIFFGDRLPE